MPTRTHRRADSITAGGTGAKSISSGAEATRLGTEPIVSDKSPTIPICYYRKAMHLMAIANELLEDPRANKDTEVIETTTKLLSLVADIKTDNPSCWDHGGACPKCPEPGRDTK